MSPLSRAFIITAIISHLCASLIGAGLAFDNVYVLQIRYIHTHGQTLGFVAFLIYGVAYHIFPRFEGRPLYSMKLGWLHYWLALTGLVILLAGRSAWIPYMSPAGGIVSACGVCTFAFNMLMTLKRSRP